MKWFKELIARIFLGKKVTKSFNVKDAVATVHMDDGQTHAISRRGTLDSFRSEVYGDDGRELLEHYMSHSKRHILKADDGAIVLLEQSPNDGLLIAKGKNKITLWPDQLKELIKVFQAWQDGR